ncbi:NAD(P)/FAD-dependent oxidoreductase [Allokutzneria albata]|uniref:Reductase C-terminal n=1 Tax=Allokutzneria albata TaxID=211114 RepID=A0A1G9WFF6_ALLAB|nr:FAD-dependent oxidoreductase [Allokutzneria albata]SDM83219.1 Reductase C-terminal [Allokutzneria albata]
MDRIVVVGAGPAGMSAAQELRAGGHTGEIVVVGAEPHRPYRRPPLSKEFLLGEHARAPLLHDDLRLTWLRGRTATGLDLRARQVLLDDRRLIDFDGLVIATGVRPRRLPHITPALVLRTLDDARALRARLASRPRVVVVGAGFLGGEIAATARELGLSVSIVDRSVVPLHRALGPVVGQLMAELHREHGVRLHPGRTVEAVNSTGTVRLDDGTVLEADLLITALGSRPETEWVRGSGLDVDNGVLVDDDGLAAPGVIAAGDVARWPQPLLDGQPRRVEHHVTAVEQAARAARALLGLPCGPAPIPSFWSHLYGRRLQAVGHTGAAYESQLVATAPGGRFLAEYRSRGRLVGAVAVGMSRDLAALRRELV